MLPLPLLALVASSVVPIVNGQISSSWPQAYPGMPDVEYGPAWQNLTEPLPNVTWDLGRSFAGNIPVNRQGHPNDTLFFWAFERENGSLTATAGESDEPWGIWLNGGPGASSIAGLLYENGPIHLNPDFSAYENNYSFSNLADCFWIDQPVGTGWSTADETGFVYDEDQVGTDFMGFLENLVKVFPSLATRPLYLTGESYAVNLAKIVIGNGTVGSDAVVRHLPTTTVIQTYPQLIGYDPEVFQWFVEQTHLCGYDLNLTYPQDGHLPDLQLVYPTAPGRASQVYFASKQKSKAMVSKRELLQEGRRHYGDESVHARGRANLQRREIMKRDLAGRANGTIDPWYGCFLYDAMIEYALNFTYPWSVSGSFAGIDVYDLPDALDPKIPLDGNYFFNDPQTVAALHAPTSKQWTDEMDYYLFLGGADNDYNDPSVEPMTFFTELATNASARGLSIVLYSGNDDSLITHRGTEVVIQNTTFGGIQGFTRKPATPWYADDGSFAGIVHQERNWTYILFKGAGHLVPQQQPANAYTFLREFVLGSNTTGLVSGSKGQVSVVGGEVSSLAQDVLPGQSGIYVGSGATQSTYTFPSATIAAWESYITTATASPTRLAAQVRSTSGAKPTARPPFHFHF